MYTWRQDWIGQVSLASALVPWLVASVIIGCELLSFYSDISPAALQLLGKMLWTTSLAGLFGGMLSAVLKKSYCGIIAIAASLLFLFAAAHWEI